MAEPVRNDEPLSGTRWPESPSGTPRPAPLKSSAAEPAVPPAALLPEDTPSRPLGEWPHADMTEAAIPEETRLQNAGEAVGTALGTVVSEARDLPGRLQDRMHYLKQRFRVISGRGSAEIKERASELTDDAERKIVEVAHEAGREARQWQFRARLYARRYPFHFVAGAAAAGFAIGFLLGLWRTE